MKPISYLLGRGALGSLQVFMHGGVRKNHMALYPVLKGRDNGDTTLSSEIGPRLFPSTPINEVNYLHGGRFLRI